MKPIFLFAFAFIYLFLVSFNTSEDKIVILPGKGIIYNGDSILLNNIQFLHTKFNGELDTSEVYCDHCGWVKQHNGILFSYKNVTSSYWYVGNNFDSIMHREIEIKLNLSNDIISINNEYNLTRINPYFGNFLYFSPDFRSKGFGSRPDSSKKGYRDYSIIIYHNLGLEFSIDTINNNRVIDCIKIKEVF